MASKRHRLVRAFFTHYDEGRSLEATRVIFPTPGANLPFAEPGDDRSWLEFVDAAVWGSHPAALGRLARIPEPPSDPSGLTVYQLDRILLEMFALNTHAFARTQTSPHFRALPEGVADFIRAQQAGTLLTGSELDAIGRGLSQATSRHLRRVADYAQCRVALWQRRPELADTWNAMGRDYLSLSHSAPVALLAEVRARVESVRGTAIPVFVMESLRIQWQELLSPWMSGGAVFVFRNESVLHQCLSFGAVRKVLGNPKNLIVILNADCELLISRQKEAFESLRDLREVLEFEPIVVGEEAAVHSRVRPLLAALERAVQSAGRSYRELLCASEWLEALGDRIDCDVAGRRLGGARAFAYATTRTGRTGLESRRRSLPDSSDLGPSGRDRVGEELDRLRSINRPRSLKSVSRIQVAHVVTQLADGGHYPSRVLRDLVEYADRGRFDLRVEVCDTSVARVAEYPPPETWLPASANRAPDTLSWLASRGVDVHLQSAFPTLTDAAYDLAIRLREARVDIVVFHGSDILHWITSRVCEVPKRVCFAPGLPALRGGFDLVIANRRPGREVAAGFSRLGTRTVLAGFEKDCRIDWASATSSLTEHGVPKDAAVVASTSSHLLEDLMGEMGLAVAMVLQRCPDAFFLPIGGLSPGEREKLMRRFRDLGVVDRVKFPAGETCSAQWIRSCDLVLHAFPSGDQPALLEAMAAGKPIIAMADPARSEVKRGLDSLLSADQVLESGRAEDYANLACQMLADRTRSRAWGREVLARYDARLDPRAAVRRIERAIASCPERRTRIVDTPAPGASTIG